MIKYKKLPDDIFENIEAVKKVLLEDHTIMFAYLFGGLVRGKVPLSDVDIAIYLKDTEDIAEHKLSLYYDLTKLLKTDELDLVILNSAPLSFAGRILMNKRVLIDKAPFARHMYESITLRKYFDFTIKENTLLRRRYAIG